MIESLKKLLPDFLVNGLRKRYINKRISEWENAGCPAPAPHVVKQKIISDYQRKTGYGVMVETGTHKGAMIEAQKRNFSRIFSIELSDEFFEKATQRFKSDKHITIVHGDSGKKMPEVIGQLAAPAVFWLDGHYSHGATAKGELECPIYGEIDAILGEDHFNHVLLIDDARCFVGKDDYPTLEELEKYVKSKDSKYQLTVEHDVIRCEKVS